MNPAATALIQCSNKDCKVAETGKCVEGHEVAVCTNYGKPLQLVEAVATEADDVAHADVIALPGADKLSVSMASQVLRRDASRVIAIIGPHDAGKTSLIAGLYDLFQSGPIRDIHFRGSKTLHGFEIACHDARAASERGTPHVIRTRRGEVQFYHLALARVTSGEELGLVLADRAGEEYRDAADDVSLASDFVEVHRADTIALLVDGARLANNLTRHNVRAEIILLIQALRDGEALTRTQRLAVVLTKLDEVNASPNRDRVLRDLDTEVRRLRETCTGDFSAIEAFCVAASPKTSAAQRGTGVSELLEFWLLQTQQVSEPMSQLPRPSRVFDRIVAVEG
jgi:hypothetical protein